MTNTCIYCNSKDINLVETTKNKITETCNSCKKEITYDRIKVGRRGKQTYIEAINYALNLMKQPKVMIVATGKRRLTLLDTIYMMNLSVEVLEWKQQQTESGGLELRMILREIGNGKQNTI